jgi:hypothetical protein
LQEVPRQDQLDTSKGLRTTSHAFGKPIKFL